MFLKNGEVVRHIFYIIAIIKGYNYKYPTLFFSFNPLYHCTVIMVFKSCAYLQKNFNTLKKQSIVQILLSLESEPPQNTFSINLSILSSSKRSTELYQKPQSYPHLI